MKETIFCKRDRAGIVALPMEFCRRDVICYLSYRRSDLADIVILQTWGLSRNLGFAYGILWKVCDLLTMVAHYRAGWTRRRMIL